LAHFAPTQNAPEKGLAIWIFQNVPASSFLKVSAVIDVGG